MHISLSIWNKSALVNFQRIQIGLPPQVRGFFLVYRKFTCAYLFQIALEII